VLNKSGFSIEFEQIDQMLFPFECPHNTRVSISN